MNEDLYICHCHEYVAVLQKTVPVSALSVVEDFSAACFETVLKVANSTFTLSALTFLSCSRIMAAPMQLRAALNFGRNNRICMVYTNFFQCSNLKMQFPLFSFGQSIFFVSIFYCNRGNSIKFCENCVVMVIWFYSQKKKNFSKHGPPNIDGSDSPSKRFTHNNCVVSSEVLISIVT